MRKMVRIILAAAMAVTSAMASAQCGYGTSQQDCMHQQQQQHVNQMNELARQQNGNGQQSYYSYSSVGGVTGPAAVPTTVTHAATAYHPDATDIWAVWNVLGSFEQARDLAILACKREMGDGCAPGAGVTEGSIAAARDENGMIWTWYGETPEDAKQGVQSECAKIEQRCTVIRTITTTHWKKGKANGDFGALKTSFPDRNTVLKKAAAVAWPQQTLTKGPWKNKSWLVSGVEGIANAQRQALQLCERDSGATCVVGRYVIGASIVQYVNDKNVTYFTGVLEPSKAASQIKEVCTQYKEKCQIVAIHSSETPVAKAINNLP